MRSQFVKTETPVRQDTIIDTMRKTATGHSLMVPDKVGRCRLTASKPELKARLVSALKITMRCTAFKLWVKFNLRRYNKGAANDKKGPSKVGRCRLTVSKPELKGRLVQRLKLNCDEPLSNVAFNFNMRRYTKVYREVVLKPYKMGPIKC
jgi:hypothetical protein